MPLHVHVRNDDTEPHTFHMHGLIYGIDSDGAWPFGVADADGHRSDAICPGDEWCYVFDVTNETVGALVEFARVSGSPRARS